VILVAGEALIDLMPIPGAEHHFDARPGGAPCNVAVGLARLGQRTCFLGRIGADPFGHLLRRHLADAGVDLSMAVPAAEATTLAVASLDGHGQAEYSFYASGTADWQWAEPEIPRVLPAEARALYVGGLALRIPPGAAVLEGFMRRAWQQGGVLIFFDPNVRSGSDFTAFAERARVERQLKLAHVVKASEDDIALLYPGREYREIAAEWRRMTSGIVIVTLGADGVYALTAEGAEITVPAVPADVVDTVGAGDAFASALLDGVVSAVPNDTDPGAGLRHMGIDVTRRLLERAAVSAAFTCGRAGAESADAAALDDAVQRARQDAVHAGNAEHRYDSRADPWPRQSGA
jgi:fructokinase